MAAVAGIRGVLPLVRLGEPGEGIRRPDDPVVIAVRAEDSAHHDRDAPAPAARLDEVAVDAVRERGLDALTDVSKPLETDHRLGVDGPVPSLLPALGVTGVLRLAEA